MLQVLLNLGYALMLVGLAIREIFWLRVVLMSAQLSLFVYAISANNRNVALWNFLFFVINTYQALRLFQERRPINIPEELSDLYKNIFSTMSRREFLYFWHLGHSFTTSKKMLIRQGAIQKQILLILEGTVSVRKNEKVIVQLGRGKFVAEMSFLTGEPASADVLVDGHVTVISWEQEKLRTLKSLNPNLLIKIQNILGTDLAQKIKVASNKQMIG